MGHIHAKTLFSPLDCPGSETRLSFVSIFKFFHVAKLSVRVKEDQAWIGLHRQHPRDFACLSSVAKTELSQPQLLQVSPHYIIFNIQIGPLQGFFSRC